MTEQLKNEISTLIENAKIAYISSVDENGYPNTKAMLSLQHDDLFTHYFSTTLSCQRTQQFLKNPNACVYFCDENQFIGLMLVGEVKVMTDREHKSKLWRDGFEIYYPDGIDTKDYCVYKFVAQKANYYYKMKNINFTLEDYKNVKL